MVFQCTARFILEKFYYANKIIFGKWIWCSVNYIIKNKELENLRETFKDYDFIFSCLLVDEPTIIKRDLLRPEDCQMHERSLILLKEFINCNYDNKYVIDSSNLTVEETVEKILHVKNVE